jgi:exo-beta-1,3-glucanase (GH17 family)
VEVRILKEDLVGRIEQGRAARVPAAVRLAAFCVLAMALLVPLDATAQQESGRAAGVAKLPKKIRGLDYGPFRPIQRPGGPCPTQDEILEDFRLLRKSTKLLRTYGLLDCRLGEKSIVAAAATRRKLALGVWLGRDPAGNDRELAELERLVEIGLGRVVLLIVGNEALLRGDITLPELLEAIERVREIAPGIAITTSEPWHIWVGEDSRYTDVSTLIDEVDIAFINAHPYWDGACAEDAVDAVFDRVARLEAAWPELRVVISETGWPTRGETNQCAEPSVEAQQAFTREFLCRARKAKLGYFFFSAFDELWKVPEAESAWGLFDADREAKHELTNVKRCPR